MTDVTLAAGISFRHESGARGEMLTPETFGPGAGWFDHDGDGRVDLLIVNGNFLRGALDPAAHPVLYRNLGDGKFADVTTAAGLDKPLVGMGMVSADVDNDGDQDLLIYGLHRSLFYRNERGQFRDWTLASGLATLSGWVGAATVLDYDRDGRLDLFVGNYVTWTPELELAEDCSFGTGRKNYCPVAVFSASAPQLFRGRGDGTFEEVTARAGLAGLKGKSLGVVVEDFDRDGWPDILVANDTVPGFCLRNRTDGTFEDVGLETGFAAGADGAPFAGMGIDSAWLPNDGALCVATGNFSGEPTTLHVAAAPGQFAERSFVAGIGTATLDRVTFGCALLDWDLDGALDLFLANGHVFDVEATTRVAYRQKAQLFLGRGGGKLEGAFVEVQSSAPKHFLKQPILGRALAPADFDDDGDLDILVTENQGRVWLIRNDLPAPKQFVRIDLQGTKSNRDALGAEVTLQVARAGGTYSVRRTRQAVASYLSQPERVLTFGLGPGPASLGVEVLWPSGLREVFTPLVVNTTVRLVEGKGSPRASGETPAVSGAQSLPTNSEARRARKRGLELLALGRFAEAVAPLDAAVQLEPLDFGLLRGRLSALWQSRQRVEARTRAREIMAAFRDANVLVSQFAVVLDETGLGELAAMFFEEALRLDPRRLDAWIALGNFAFDGKAYADAVRYYERALELRPGALEALTNAGKALTALKEYSRATAYLERAITVSADHAAALSTLGGIAMEEGQLDRAEELLMRALASARSRESKLSAYGNLGILHLRRQDRVSARACFEKVLEVDPRDERAKAALEKLRD